ncbi:flap endonuclease-1 [Candidatus Micrarchaeota archaeon]|nr:flap endonuclease-1 [Candidatus Micrarchaeota archaeon]MBU1930993.1 flap endonuclease-1 [Candidatus Micrarchaeota archaeon]
MGTPIGELVSRKPVSFADLNGRKISVDSHNILYQFLSNIRGADGSPLTDSKGRITSHLTGLLYRTTNWLEAGIKPIFVFDGKHHKLKGETILARNEIRTKAKQKFEDAQKKGDLEIAKKFAAQSSRLTPEMVSDAKELIALMGLPVVQAPSEGESQAAFMTAKGDVFALVSQDFDALLFGCPRVLRNFASSGKRKLPGRNVYIDVSPELLELEPILKELEIDRKKLVWLSILVGTDFNEKFPKIGPKTALKLVKSHDSFEEIIRETGFEPKFDFKEIEQLFLEPEHTEKYEIAFSNPQSEKLKSFLVDKHDFNETRVDNVIQKLQIKAQDKGEQSRLGNWT